MYSKKFLENSSRYSKGFAFEYNILYSCTVKAIAFSGFLHKDKNKNINDGGFDFNFCYNNKYYLVQVKCCSNYNLFLYDSYEKFINDLKEQSEKYIGIFVVGTFSKD
jgi:hypothetical protein